MHEAEDEFEELGGVVSALRFLPQLPVREEAGGMGNRASATPRSDVAIVNDEWDTALVAIARQLAARPAQSAVLLSSLVTSPTPLSSPALGQGANFVDPVSYDAHVRLQAHLSPSRTERYRAVRAVELT
jgi:hypothetical protein